MSGFIINMADETEDRHPRACHLRPVDPCAEEPRRVARYGTVLQPAKVASSDKSGTPCEKLSYRVIAEREAREPKSDNLQFVPSVKCGRQYRPGRACQVPQLSPQSQFQPGHMNWCHHVLDSGSTPDPPPPTPRCYSEEELKGTGWGYCPPCVDYRELIIPLDPSTPSSKRPTGHPYFNHGARSCEEVVIPIACKKGVFRFCDWMATVQDREPPPSFQDQCIPSTCTWCEPSYENCCPRYCDPSAYTMARAT